MASKKSGDVAVVENEATELAVFPKMNDRQDLVTKVTDLESLRNYIGQDVAWSEIEPSFDVIAKSGLVDIPFILGGFRFNESSKYATPDPENPNVLVPAMFVSMLVASYDEENEVLNSPWCIVNDGSTGIMKQLLRYLGQNTDEDLAVASRSRLNELANACPPIRAERGLRVSEYPYEDPITHKVSTAQTYYLG